jgi:hypothetical protein
MSFEGALERLCDLAIARLEAARDQQRPFAVTYMVAERALSIGYQPGLGDYEVQWLDGTYVAQSEGRQATGPTPDAALLQLCLGVSDRTAYLFIPPLLPE